MSITTPEAAIQVVLAEHIKAFGAAKNLPISYPGQPFKPPSSVYLAVTYLPNTPQDFAVSDDADATYMGLYQIKVMSPQQGAGDRGFIPMSEIAGLVVEHFSRSTRLYREGMRVDIEATPFVAQPLSEPDRTSIPVTVRWRAQRTTALPPVINLPSPILVNESKVEVPIIGQPGARFTLFVNGAVAGTATADSEGKATIEVELADGAYTLTATQVVGAGHVSKPSAAVKLTVDTLAPDAPIILTESPFVTTNTIPVIGGTAEAGATIAIYLDAEWDGETVADDDGAWEFIFDDLDAGETFEVTATATDAAGNTSAPSVPLTLVVNHPLAIEGEPVTLGIMGEAYAGFTASVPPQHGVPPFIFSMLNAAPGLSIDAVTGEVSGTLTQAGIFEGIVAQVEDSE